MTEIEWIECDDPERLAAAVAAGVRVERSFLGDGGWLSSTLCRSADFASRIKRGDTFRLPSRVVWPPALTVPEGMTPEPVVTAEEAEYLRSPERLKNLHRTPTESSPDGEGEDNDCPACGADWITGVETLGEARKGGGYRRLCKVCSEEWDDPQFSYGDKETEIRRRAASPDGEGEAGAAWHLGSQSDGLFIIDTPPRPVSDDPWHDRPDGPSLALCVSGLTAERARAIVAAHNEVVAERDALATRLAAWPEVPDGCEVLVVERWVTDRLTAWGGPTGDAARAAVDRRPQPEPRVERVNAVEALRTKRCAVWPGQDEIEPIVAITVETDVDGDEYLVVRSTYYTEPRLGFECPIDDDGKVECWVLAEDGES